MEEGWDEDKAEIDAMECIGGIALMQELAAIRKSKNN